MKTLFIKGVEFFNLLTGIGMKGQMTPFDDQRYPALSVSYPSPGKIMVSTADESVIMADTDTLRIGLDGGLSVIKGPSHYNDKWKKLIAGTTLKKSALKFSKDPVFVPYSCMALVFDSGRSLTTREAMVYHSPGKMIKGYELVILFDQQDRPAEVYVRAEKSTNAFSRLEKFVRDYELEQPESGAFDHIYKDSQARFQAKIAEDRATAARNHEKWNLVSKLDIGVPVLVEVDGKKLTVRNRTIYRGAKLGGSKLDLDNAFDTGVLHQVAAQVTAQLEANQANTM